MELTELKDYMGEEELSAIAQLLVLEDESFRTIAPVILNSIQDQVRSVEYRTEMIQQLNDKNLNAQDLAEEYQKISGVIDESSEELTEEKKDFLKQIFVIIYNSMIELVNGDLPLIQIPIELCSPDAKIPTYAHEGDAGMDVYSTIDCTLAPGERQRTICEACNGGRGWSTRDAVRDAGLGKRWSKRKGKAGSYSFGQGNMPVWRQLEAYQKQLYSGRRWGDSIRRI